jgi:L-asparaginase II
VHGRFGDDCVTPLRSSAKPFQLACSLEALDDPPLAEDELAIGAASHSAEPGQVAIVERLLARFGLDAGELRCGAHPPIHAPSAEAILRGGGAFTDLHNNCSGKHTFMLAAAKQNGWAPDYRPPEHPLQRRMIDRMHAWAGEAPGLAVDGCGVPTFCLSLSGIALAWSRVAEAMAAAPPGRARDAMTDRLGRIGRAMAARPDLTSGEGRLDLSVVRAAREPMAVKIGAMGVFCIALPARGLGLAVKVRTGSTEALPAAVAGALAELAPGAWDEPAGWPLREVRNVVGRLVGEWQTSP